MSNGNKLLKKHEYILIVVPHREFANIQGKFQVLAIIFHNWIERKKKNEIKIVLDAQTRQKCLPDDWCWSIEARFFIIKVVNKQEKINRIEKSVLIVNTILDSLST